MAAYKTSGFCGEIANPILPRLEVGKPSENFFHVSPESTLPYIAVPGPPLIYDATVRCRCQVAAYSISGFLGSIIISVAPTHSLSPNTCFHEFPESIVLKTPRSPPFDHKGP